MRTPKSTSPWVVKYRERYRNDEAFRESEKARTRSRYTPKPKQSIYKIDGEQLIKLSKFSEITGLKYALLHRLKSEGIITPAKRNAETNSYLFYLRDAYMFRDFLETFLEYPQVSTFERYSCEKLKAFMRRNKNKWDFENKCLLES